MIQVSHAVRIGSLALALALLTTACGPRSQRDDVPPGWSEDVSEAERPTLRVVVFCDVVDEGERILGLLRQAGYTNPDNYVHPTPNDDFNIKWGDGGPSQEVVAEVAAIVEQQVDRPLARKPVFEPGDRDIFVNLPLGSGERAWPVEKRDDKGFVN